MMMIVNISSPPITLILIPVFLLMVRLPPLVIGSAVKAIIKVRRDALVVRVE
jgi:hypothetical protein